jgi:hypothetical protein
MVKMFSTFANPEFGKTIMLGGEQQYRACTWRGRTWVLTDEYNIYQRKRYWMHVSEDGWVAWANAGGDWMGDPQPMDKDAFDNLIKP